MRRRIKKRVLVGILTIATFITSVPINAFAIEDSQAIEQEASYEEAQDESIVYEVPPEEAAPAEEYVEEADACEEQVDEALAEETAPAEEITQEEIAPEKEEVIEEVVVEEPLIEEGKEEPKPILKSTPKKASGASSGDPMAVVTYYDYDNSPLGSESVKLLYSDNLGWQLWYQTWTYKWNSSLPSGKHFKAWATDAGTEYSDGQSFRIYGDIKLHAVLEEEPISSTYNVTYYAQDGSGNKQSLVVEEGSYKLLPLMFTPRADYEFDYYSVNNSGKYQPGDSVYITNDTRVDCHWKQICTITYEANNGTGNTFKDTVYYKDKLKIKSAAECGFTYDGYKFVGWDDKSCVPGEEYVIYASGTLKAIWEKIPDVSITYVANNGTSQSLSEPVVNGKAKIKTAAECGFSYDGYTFVGWDLNYTPGSEYTVSSNLRLVAKWEKNFTGYTVTYIDYYRALYAKDENVNGHYVLKSDYTGDTPKYMKFYQWMDTSTLYTYYPGLAIDITKDTTFEPMFENIEYDVIFVYQNGETYQTKCGRGGTISAPSYQDARNPELPGKELFGWTSINKDGSGSYNNLTSSLYLSESLLDACLTDDGKVYIKPYYRNIFYSCKLNYDDAAFEFVRVYDMNNIEHLLNSEKTLDVVYGDSYSIAYKLKDGYELMSITGDFQVTDYTDPANSSIMKIFTVDVAKHNTVINLNTEKKQDAFKVNYYRYELGTPNNEVMLSEYAGSGYKIKDYTETRPGYMFNEWKDNESKYYIPGELCKFEKDVDLYPIFKKAIYDVIFEYNNGDLEDYSRCMDGDLDVPGWNSPSNNKSGYNVIGWVSYKQDGTAYKILKDETTLIVDADLIKNCASNTGIIKFVPLYEEVKPIKVNVKYIANNGTEQTFVDTVKVDTTYEVKDCMFTYAGYIFTGWMSDSANYNAGDKFTVKSDVKLIATWKKDEPIIPVPKLYDITYLANDGTTNEFVDSDIEEGSTYTVKDNMFTRVGYTFIGWKEDGVAVAPGTTFTVDKGHLYEAQWKKLEPEIPPFKFVIVSYDANNGKNEGMIESVLLGTFYKIKSNPYTYEGYKFIGWKEGDKIYQPGDRIYLWEERNFKAVWEKVADDSKPSDPIPSDPKPNDTITTSSTAVITTPAPSEPVKIDKLKLPQTGGFANSLWGAIALGAIIILGGVLLIINLKKEDDKEKKSKNK